MNPVLTIPDSAVVCYAADRNELRSRVIQWLQTEIVPDGWFAKGSNFSDILLKYFKVGFSWPLARHSGHASFCSRYPNFSVKSSVPFSISININISLYE